MLAMPTDSSTTFRVFLQAGILIASACYVLWSLFLRKNRGTLKSNFENDFKRYKHDDTSENEPTTEQQPLVEDLTPGRRPGEWRPAYFKYPKVDPFLDDIATHVPTPYRPFRWGDTFPINLGIKPMAPDTWIELDQEYLDTHAFRTQRTRSRGDKVVKTLSWDYPLVASSHPLLKPLAADVTPIPPSLRPSPAVCARETCGEIASYLATKYPRLFRVTYAPLESATGDPFDLKAVGNSFNNQERVKTVEILKTGEKWDLDIDDPMMIAGLLVQDDLAIMQEREDGQVYFVAGSICTAGGWRLQDKLSLPLDLIHTRGSVPQYVPKLQFSMNRFFLKLQLSKPVQRNNYHFQVEGDLSWSDLTHGPEDSYGEPINEAAEGFVPFTAADRPEQIFFRTERQTLRRLPKTGSILFTIRTYFLPVVDMVKEPGVPGRLANAIRTWPKDVAEYKALALYGSTLLPWLDLRHQEQIRQGIATNENNYPL